MWGTLGVNYAVKLAVGRERPRARPTRSIPLPSSSLVPLEPRRHVGRSRVRPDPGPAGAGAGLGGWRPRMAASRVYVGATRPGDVVAGAALGAVTGAAAGAV